MKNVRFGPGGRMLHEFYLIPGVCIEYNKTPAATWSGEKE